MTHHEQKPLHDFIGSQAVGLVVLYKRERGRFSFANLVFVYKEQNSLESSNLQAPDKSYRAMENLSKQRRVAVNNQ